MRIPRVAFFTDSFHEVNGVALTSRQFDLFARKNEYPFLSVHAGRANLDRVEGVHETVELSTQQDSHWTRSRPRLRPAVLALSR